MPRLCGEDFCHIDASWARVAGLLAVSDREAAQHGGLPVPALAFALLAMSPVRHVVIDSLYDDDDLIESEESGDDDGSLARARHNLRIPGIAASVAHYLATAPLNVSVLHLGGLYDEDMDESGGTTVLAAAFDTITSALVDAPQHGHIRRVNIPSTASGDVAGRFFAALGGLPQLVAASLPLRTSVLASLPATLRRLKLVRSEFAHTGDIDLGGLTAVRHLVLEGPYGLATRVSARVILPPNVRSIGHSFLMFGRVETLDLSAVLSLRRVGNSFLDRSSIRNVIFAPNIETFGNSCLNGCASLTALDMSHMHRMTELPWLFANGCSSLLSARLPPNLTEVGIGVFGSCAQLAALGLSEQVALPASVRRIGGLCFSNCTLLTSINLSNVVSLRSIDDSFASNCTALTTIRLPSGVEKIGTKILEYCNNIRTVDLRHLPERLTIEDHFAMSCTVLVEVRLPAGAQLGPEAHPDCAYLYGP